jgi:hypothetical protein
LIWPHDNTSYDAMIDLYILLGGCVLNLLGLSNAPITINKDWLKYELSIEEYALKDQIAKGLIAKIENQIIKDEAPKTREEKAVIKKHAEAIAQQVIGSDVDVSAEFGVTAEIQKMRRLQAYANDPLFIANAYKIALEGLKSNIDKLMRIKYVQNLYVAFYNKTEHEIQAEQLRVETINDREVIYFKWKKSEDLLTNLIGTVIKPNMVANIPKIKEILLAQQQRMITEGIKKLDEQFYGF